MATYTSNYGWAKPSGSDNVDISVLNNNLDDQDSTIHDAFLNMAPPFSESSTYAVDDIVLYGTGLYKCHTAVVTPGSWTGSTNWQVYKLSEGGSGGGGTSNYNALTNKPQINSVELSGNKTAAQLGLMASDGVVANPTGQTTGSLTALEVGGTKYAVGGGSGTSDYTDLSNKPQINGVTLSGNKTTGDLNLDYNDLKNKPTIPSAQIQSDWEQTDTSKADFIKNKPSIPDDLADLNDDASHRTVTDTEKATWNGKSDFSGSYADLTDKPENANTFQGTIAEWNQLTTAEKKAYDHASIPDSLDGNVTFPASKVMLNSGDSVEEKIGNMRMVKLWENPNPSEAFAAQDITGLSMSGYDLFVVTTSYGTCLFPSTQRGIVCLNGSSAGVKYFFKRTFTPNVSNNKITVSDCVGTKLTDGSDTNFNQTIIPLTIYGIKLT